MSVVPSSDADNSQVTAAPRYTTVAPVPDYGIDPLSIGACTFAVEECPSDLTFGVDSIVVRRPHRSFELTLAAAD